MRLDRTPVLPFLDDDGVTRPARVLARSNGRVLLMVTRDVGIAWWPADRLQPAPAEHGGLGEPMKPAPPLPWSPRPRPHAFTAPSRALV